MTKARGQLTDSLAYPPRGMDVERAAAYVGFGRTRFLEMVDEGTMPKPIRFRGEPRWDRFELDRAFEDQRRSTNRIETTREDVRARLRQSSRTNDED